MGIVIPRHMGLGCRGKQLNKLVSSLPLWFLPSPASTLDSCLEEEAKEQPLQWILPRCLGVSVSQHR